MGQSFFFFLIGIGFLAGVFPFVFTIIHETRVAAEKEEMFLEFGGTLPTLTKNVINPWFTITLGMLSLSIFSTQWLKPVKASIKRRRAVIVISFVTASVSFAICIVGLYQPIFRLAGSVG